MRETAFRSAGPRAALLCGILALILYWPFALGRIPFPAQVVTQFPPWESTGGRVVAPPVHAEMGDLGTELYPWKVHTYRSFKSGTFPLWNPFLLLGAPFVGDPQTGLFYPPNVLYLFVPTPVAWSMSFLLRIVLCGALTAIFVRRLGATPSGSILSGIIFAFCGWVTAFQARPHLDSVLWLPMVLLAVDALQTRPSRAAVALAAGAFALPVLAGQPESAFHVTLVAILFFLYRLGWPPKDPRPPARPRRTFVLLFAAAGALALGFAAVQMLPALEFIGQLNRALAMLWPPKPLHQIAAFVSRDLRGNPNSIGVWIPECAAYAGMLPLLLAPLALLHRNRRDAIFFVALLAILVQIVYGLGPAYALSLLTPVLKGMPNGRLLAVADFGIAVLAGLGASTLDENSGSPRRNAKRWILPGAALVTVGAALWLVPRHSVAPEAAPSWSPLRGLGSSALLLAIAAGLLAAVLTRRISTRAFARVALVVVAFDLCSAAYDFVPFAPVADVYPPNPTFRFLASVPEPHRVVAVDRTYAPGSELVYGLDSAIGFNVVDARIERVLGIFGYQTHEPGMTSEAIVGAPNRLLDLMNLRYLVTTTWNRGAATLGSRADRFRLVFSDSSIRVFENRNALPRAFLVPWSGIEVLADEKAQFARIGSADFDPSRSVVLPEAVPVPFRGEAAPALPPGVPRVLTGVNEVLVETAVAEPSILVLSQTHYPGWTVSVDGAPATLLRADYAFDGVALSPGRHAVRFALEPTSLRIGALITLASLVVVGFLVRPGRRT
jgi:Bacterial membrane protein YfhO